MDLLLFVLLFLGITLSLTLLITKSYIFETIRNFLMRISPNFVGVLFSCPQCTGFWIGVLVGIIINPVYPFIIAFLTPNLIIFKGLIYVISVVFSGAISSGFAYSMDILFDYLTATTELAELQKKKYMYDMLVKSDIETAQQIADQILLEILEEESN